LDAVRNILEFSTIAAADFSLDETVFDLHASLGEAQKLLAPAAHSKGLELLLEIRPNTPRFVRGDPAPLLQVIAHLTGNAVKFTEHGEILLRVELDSKDEQGIPLRFDVLASASSWRSRIRFSRRSHKLTAHWRGVSAELGWDSPLQRAWWDGWAAGSG